MTDIKLPIIDANGNPLPNPDDDPKFKENPFDCYSEGFEEELMRELEEGDEEEDEPSPEPPKPNRQGE